MKPSTSHQSSNNHRLATSSLTLLASCAASSTASRCCAVLWPGNQSGHAKIPAPEFGEVVHQEARDRPRAQQLHTCSCIITGGRRAIPDGLMDGSWMLKARDGRRCASRSIHPKSGQLLPRFPPERDTHGHGRHQCSSSQPALLGHCRLSPVASNNAIVQCKFACATCFDEIERGKKECRHQCSSIAETVKFSQQQEFKGIGSAGLREK